MGVPIEIYHTATESFLQKFDSHWNRILKEIDSQQAQLISGNRLRPQICLWGYLSTVPPCEVHNHNYDQIANIAVSIELVHKASLLLDDWIDDDNERHGHPAFHTEHGPEYTVIFALNLIGLSMLRLENIFSNSLVLPQHYNLCLNTLIKTIYNMAKGAMEEIKLKKSEFFNSEKIREIAQLETAEILGNSMLIGYYFGNENNRNQQVEAIFKKIGDQCGYLFQALNDIEAFGNPEGLKIHKGKVNLDFFSGRKNLAVSSLYQVANKRDQSLLLNATEAELFDLVKKYKIVETLREELKVVYGDILATTTTLQTVGLPLEWCEGFRWFLHQVKGYAEARLSE